MAIEGDDLSHELKVEGLLNKILKELRIANIYNQLAHGEEVTKQDIED